MAAEAVGGFSRKAGEEAASALADWLRKAENREALKNSARNAGKITGAAVVSCATAVGSILAALGAFVAAHATACLVGAAVVVTVGVGVYLVISS
jgi:hypothetical protein